MFMVVKLVNSTIVDVGAEAGVMGASTLEGQGPRPHPTAAQLPAAMGTGAVWWPPSCAPPSPLVLGSPYL